jgi:hypothetical protein
MRPLSYRQRMFVDFYLGEASRSPVDAARRAGYRWPEKAGPRLVKKGEVQAAIDASVATAAMASNEVLARVAEVASVDMLGFMNRDQDGFVKADLELVQQLGLGHLIKRLRINKDGTQDIELEPRVHALVKLGEHYNLWKGGKQTQVTLVDVAKHLRARYEQLRGDGKCGKAAGDLPGGSGAVQ